MKTNVLLTLVFSAAVFLKTPYLMAQSLPAGEIIFVRECAKCHQIGEGAQNRIGPQLNHLLGRKAGSVADYNDYSDALSHADFIWTPEKFRSFIKDPKKIVEGTMQIYNGLSDDQQISALIEFLNSPKNNE
jgi:cytochrome c